MDEFNVSIDVIPGSVCIIDARGEILAVNASWIQYSRDNGGPEDKEGWIGKNYFAACRAAADRNVYAAETLAGLTSIASGRRETFAMEYPCHWSGDSRWFELVANRIGDNGDVILIHSEITEKKQILRAYDEAADGHANISRLLATMTHDFANVLTIVSGQIQLAMMTETRQGIDACLAQAQGTVDAAALLNRRLLTMHAARDLGCDLGDPAPAIEEAVSLLSRLLAPKIDLLAHLEPALWPISVSAAEVQSMLVNLVLNAKDAITGRGQVVIDVRNIRAQSGTQSDGPTVESSDHVRMSVRDDGCGMSEVMMRRAATPFYSTKLQAGGTGLGLTSVDKCARQAGGSIEIRSAFGAGTEVIVRLPSAKSA